MRRHDHIEQWVSGKGVFLEREEVVVAVMLETGCEQEQRQANKRSQRGSIGNLDVIQGQFVRSEGS